MRAVTKHEFLFLLYLVSLSVVAMAPVGVFLGIGFLLLAPPDRAASPAESVSPPQALEAQEVPPPANNDTALGSSSAFPADNVAASPLLSTLPLSNAATAGPSLNRKAPALESTAMKPALTPPGRNHPCKKNRSRAAASPGNRETFGGVMAT